MNLTDNLTEIISNITPIEPTSPPSAVSPTAADILGRLGLWATTSFKSARNWTQGHVSYDIVFAIALAFTILAIIWILRKFTK